MAGGGDRGDGVVAALTELGVVVRELDTLDAVTDPATVGLLDLSALDASPLTADGARDRVVGVLELARAVDARPEELRVVAVTSIDGRHGFGGGGLAADAPVQAAGSGFWKCAAKEWRRHHVRCLDVSADLDSMAIARHLVAELGGAVPGDELEHGLDAGGLWGIGLSRAEISARAELPDDAVVLAVGGAQGIGAAVLAGAVAGPGRTIVMAGRTDPDSVALPAGVSADSDEMEIRAALVDEVRATGERAVLSEVERSVRRVMAAQKVRATVDRLESTGATVEYHVLDARDGEAVTALVEATIARHGRLDLVVHAAGVIADAPVSRKTPDSIESVLGTKTAPALALCEAVGDDTTVVFFGSVAGRFGNASQADYGAANEFLAKLAAQRRAAGADVRCLVWGPWDSGMVSSGLLAVYDALGIVPIASEAGVEAFARELTDRPGGPEVVLANSTDVMAGLRWPPTAVSVLGS